MTRMSMYQIKKLDSVDELVDKLINYTHVGCAGFRFNDVLYINVSISENGAQEYEVIEIEKETSGTYTGVQFESITVSWMSPEKLKKLALEYNSPTNRESYKKESWASACVVNKHTKEACYYCA